MNRQRQREIELTAKPIENCSIPVYANRVDITRLAAAENWSVATLNINFGLNPSGFTFGLNASSREEAQAKEDAARKEFANGDYFVSGREVVAYGGKKVPNILYYTLDLKALIPEGWEFKIVKVGKNLRQIGVIAYEQGYLSKTSGAHPLDESDLRNEDAEQCEEHYRAYYRDEIDAKVRCQREDTHVGEHQAFANDFFYNWQAGGASRSPHLPFGFTCRCPYCGQVGAGNETGIKICFTCEHWLSLEKRRDKDSFVIKGRHYRPGAGGFGGRKFTVRRQDDSIWKGELFTQGEVPSWMIGRFPDNAEFVEEQKPAQAPSQHAGKSWTQLMKEAEVGLDL
jgi:hypothetical protein